VYPYRRTDAEPLQTVDTIQVDATLRPLYEYLAMRGSFVSLDNYREDNLEIFSRDVLNRISAGDRTWERMVPTEVAELIRARSFFEYAESRHN
jgi:hypothetical protein